MSTPTYLWQTREYVGKRAVCFEPLDEPIWPQDTNHVEKAQFPPKVGEGSGMIQPRDNNCADLRLKAIKLDRQNVALWVGLVQGKEGPTALAALGIRRRMPPSEDQACF